jgi:hypothetical protein
MEATVVNALIATGGLIVGGTIAAVASVLNTQHKLKELEVAASQKLRDNYLQNAREYTKAIYIPLTLAISELYDAYASFRTDPVAKGTIDTFRTSLDDFRIEVKRLRDSGAEAFLTNELEDRLRSFAEFLEASRNATELTRKAEIGFRIGFGGLSWAQTSAVVLIDRAARWCRSPRMSFDLFGVVLLMRRR